MHKRRKKLNHESQLLYATQGGIDKNLLDMSFDEIKQVPQFLTFKNFVHLPRNMESLGACAPVVYRYYDFGYRALLQKKHSPFIEKVFKDFAQNYFSVSNEASLFETLWNCLEHKKRTYVEKKVETEFYDFLRREHRLIQKKITVADQAYPWFVQKIKDCDPLEQDIALHANPIDEFVDSNEISLVTFADNSVEGIANRLKPLHNSVALYKKLQPDSEFLHRGVIDVDDSSLGGSSKWQQQKLIVVNSPLQPLDDDTLKTTFKKIHYIEPKEPLSEVILAEKTKHHLTALLHNYKLGLKQKNSLLLMLTGAPGTGKTMTAQAVATELGRPLMKVQLGDIERKFMPNLVSYVLTRARLKNAVVLFDECEDLLWTSYATEISSPWMKVLLENHEGCCIFTSNYKVGSDFLRRMDYVIQYKISTPQERAHLLVKKLKVQNRDLSMDSTVLEKALGKTSITGGYFQQVIDLAQALSGTVEHLSSVHLVEAIETIQKTHCLQAPDASKEPQMSLQNLKLGTTTRKTMDQLVAFAKRRAVDPLLPFKGGCVALFYGPSGTGKTMAAEGVAHELGLKLKKITASDLLSKWVGETENNIRKTFEDSQNDGHVLFIDEAEGLMSSRENGQRSWELTQVNEFLRQIEDYEGILILATNHRDLIDPAMARRFLFHVEFERPSFETRLEIWKSWQTHIPLSEDELTQIAKNYDLTGGDILNVVKKYIAWSQNGVNELHQICRQQLSQHTGSHNSPIGF